MLSLGLKRSNVALTSSLEAYQLLHPLVHASMIAVISTVEFVSLLLEFCDLLSFILRHFLANPEVLAAILVLSFPG